MSWMKWIRDSKGEVIGVGAEFCVTREEAAKRWPEAYKKFLASNPPEKKECYACSTPDTFGQTYCLDH